MQYQVPHFLETEQRILGPFTFHKFIIAIGVGGVLFILYYQMNFVWWLMTAIFASGITLMLMFGSWNGRPLTRVMVDFFGRLIHTQRYTWSGEAQKESVSEFILTKENLRRLPNTAAPKEKDEKPIHQRFEEISKTLDDRN